MKNIFRVAVAAIAMTIAAFTANAQTQGDMAGGAKLALGNGDGYSGLGLGIKFQYNITDPLRLEAGFACFLPKKVGSGLAEIKTNRWDFSVNAHWLFRMSDKVNLYPLGGLGVLGAHSKVSSDLGGGSMSLINANDSYLGLNLGGGVDYFLSDKSFLNAEAKYLIAGGGFFVVSAGYGFMF